MLMEHASGSRSLRAPQGDGQKLIDPPWELLPDVLAQNRQRLAQTDHDMQGRSLVALATSARQALLKQAITYTSRYRNVPQHWYATQAASTPFVLSGHQPQLFHPGVWYKNFVLGALARQVGGVGIHLLIDSDLCRSASIRVPTGTAQQPRVEAVLYDQPTAEVPYEERTIRDFATVESFATRVVALLEPLVRDPLVEELWPLTLQRYPGQMNLGLRLAQGRHALEETWNNQTLELPQSAVCQLPEFCWFLAHVLAHLPRFWTVYNEALADYRRENRLRNQAHPVPDLAESDGWLEAPFWIWSADDPLRRPLLVRQAGDELILTDRGAHTIRLALSAEIDATSAVEQLLTLSSRGIKIRTRALTTTLFARLMLSDLFLHGIGGAKYDQVTDQIGREFFGFTLPEFAAVSATLRLPIAAPRSEPLNNKHWEQQLRELQFHPERFLEQDGAPIARLSAEAAAIIAEKRRWVSTPKTPQNARQRHLAITAANEALQPFVADTRRQTERQRDELQHRKRAEDILHSRDYAFCLYPRRHFNRLLADLPS